MKELENRDSRFREFFQSQLDAQGLPKRLKGLNEVEARLLGLI
jgi:hypothetical protein